MMQIYTVNNLNFHLKYFRGSGKLEDGRQNQQ